MKKLAWLVGLLFPLSILCAQQPGLQAPGTFDPGMLASRIDLRLRGDSMFIASLLQAVQPSQQPKPKSSSATPPKPMKRTKIDPSMVGYIEDSAVQTQVRVRFDAGFNAPRPDRAEYFYAGIATPAGLGDPVQRTLNFQQLYLNGEYAPLKYFSAFVQIPFRWIQPIFSTHSQDLFSGGGISDVQAGFKLAALATDSRNLTFQLRAYFPTGDGAAGFGTNHYSIEPMLLFCQKISDRTSVEAEAGDTHPIGGTVFTASPGAAPQNFAGDVLMYGVGPSYRLITRDSYRVAPVFELVAWHVFGGLQTGANNVVQSADGINVLNAKLGARTSLANGSSIYAGYGRGLTSQIWYRNLFRIEYRRVF